MKLKTLALGAILAATAASALAYTRYYSTVYYYSDASRTTYVGSKTTNCQNQVDVSGTVTSYSRIVERYRCDGAVP